MWPPLLFSISISNTHIYTIHALLPQIFAGFLAYLFFVGNEPYPPLVHSLSYGDVEQNVFNASVPGSVEYGRRYARYPSCWTP